MPVYEGATVEEAIQKGLMALKLTRDDVEVNVIEVGKKGFLGIGKKEAKVSMEPTVSEEIAEAVEEAVEEVISEEAPVITEIAVEVEPSIHESNKPLEDLDDESALTELALYLTAISKELNAPALVRMERKDGLIIMHLDTQKQGILIGKHGKILNALQYLAQVFIHRAASNKLSVVVNVGDYREKRQAILQRLAERTAEKVKQTGRPVFLEPMPAFERKQIHSVLSKKDYVKTHSEGDEPYRYLVVEPEKKHF
ncbi:RNA-binding protein [Enterococcus phoeniculicola]|jgi:spoIIIJ-associated protein|uniref:RNA-binding protein KhpB n=1 Tax=Enterococcus phoeniculicola ATCC BAA-412 TaxID=1158610 RepID=R3WP38_9ENTE|nr:RNA-binding cell elongation regulator Jag/EloR [Enterococcus phoeniculicola]EOL49207.1 RNA-binding protein [Enterococcus phoeniculicola ATCC BAA-412]EOT71375.1 RNA-binding protein [Enterococcus phoeniculicola ATCC BAA-412]OJG69569.1 RNA-binding protein [Enterococcus phoeniculicola]